MENNNNWLFILVGIIIGGLVFGGGAYFLTKDNSNNKDNNNKNSNKDENKQQNKIKVLSGTYSSSPTTVILSEKEVYISFEATTDGNNNIIYKDEYSQDFCESVEKLAKHYSTYTFENAEIKSISDFAYLNSYQPTLNNKFYGIKLNVSNVKSVYTVILGQDTIPEEQGIAILKDDNSLEFISFADLINNKTTPIALELNNITSMKYKNEDGVYTYAIDKDGKEYLLYDYIEKE